MKGAAALLLLIFLHHTVEGQLESNDTTCLFCSDAGERVWPPPGFVDDENELRCSFRCSSDVNSNEVRCSIKRNTKEQSNGCFRQCIVI